MPHANTPACRKWYGRNGFSSSSWDTGRSEGLPRRNGILCLICHSQVGLYFPHALNFFHLSLSWLQPWRCQCSSDPPGSQSSCWEKDGWRSLWWEKIARKEDEEGTSVAHLEHDCWVRAISTKLKTLNIKLKQAAKKTKHCHDRSCAAHLLLLTAADLTSEVTWMNNFR